jgi:hypothetical protein
MTRLANNEPIWTEHECGGDHFVATVVAVRSAGKRGAIASIELHRVDGINEAEINVTFHEGDSGECVTFGCRYGPIPGEPEPTVMVIDGADLFDDDGVWGRGLKEDEVLAHPLWDEFVKVVNVLVYDIPLLDEHVRGRVSSQRGRGRGRVAS